MCGGVWLPGCVQRRPTLQPVRTMWRPCACRCRPVWRKPYFAVRAAEAQQRLLADTLAAYQRSWELTQNRYRAGVASSADVAQAHTPVARRAGAAARRPQQPCAARTCVGRAAGPGPCQFHPGGDGRAAPPPALPAQLPAQPLQRRPDIAAAQQRVQAANAQVGVARAAFFPQLSFSASAGYRAAQWADALERTGAGVVARPCAGGHAVRWRRAQRGAGAGPGGWEQASASYRQTVLTALQEVEDNLVLGASLEREQAVHTEAVATAQRALAVVENQYRAGLVGYLECVGGAGDGAVGAQQFAVGAQSPPGGQRGAVEKPGRGLAAHA